MVWEALVPSDRQAPRAEQMVWRRLGWECPGSSICLTGDRIVQTERRSDCWSSSLSSLGCRARFSPVRSFSSPPPSGREGSYSLNMTEGWMETVGSQGTPAFTGPRVLVQCPYLCLGVWVKSVVAHVIAAAARDTKVLRGWRRTAARSCPGPGALGLSRAARFPPSPRGRCGRTRRAAGRPGRSLPRPRRPAIANPEDALGRPGVRAGPVRPCRAWSWVWFPLQRGSRD